jgi:hypothetical protein
MSYTSEACGALLIPGHRHIVKYNSLLYRHSRFCELIGSQTTEFQNLIACLLVSLATCHIVSPVRKYATRIGARMTKAGQIETAAFASSMCVDTGLLHDYRYIVTRRATMSYTSEACGALLIPGHKHIVKYNSLLYRHSRFCELIGSQTTEFQKLIAWLLVTS